MYDLIELIKEHTKLTESEQSVFIEFVKHKKIRKGELLLESGKIPKYIYFNISGLFRGCTNQNGKLITTWFVTDKEIFTSFSSFVSQKPSNESIECISEEAQVFYISFENLYSLYDRFLSFNVLGRKIIENYLFKIEERAFQLQNFSAKERYEHLLKHQPNLFQSVNLGHIASYLGMTQETLSRIRGI